MKQRGVRNKLEIECPIQKSSRYSCNNVSGPNSGDTQYSKSLNLGPTAYLVIEGQDKSGQHEEK